jgi:hypothetical protein
MAINENRKCTGCNDDLVLWGEANIVGGVDFHLSCGYSEFSDMLSMNVNLCHDCSVRLFRIIDPHYKLLNSHPTMSRSENKRCCKWAILPKYRFNSVTKKMIKTLRRGK